MGVPMSWPSRAFLVLIAAVAFAAVMSGTACTRRGSNTPAPPTPTPIGTYYVNPVTGNDSNSGTQTSPFKTLTKAVKVVSSSTTPNLTIMLAPGDYHGGTNGEVFPIVFPTGMTVTGTNYGGGSKTGTFIDGWGEDTTYEKLAGAPAKSFFATLEAGSTADVNVSNLYVGASKLINLPKSAINYTSIDVLGTVSASLSTLSVTPGTGSHKVNGVLIPGGSFTCSACTIVGNFFGIEAFSVPSSGSTSSSSPHITLSVGSSGSATVTSRDYADIITDGSANLTISGITFGYSGRYAYIDNIKSASSSSGSAPSSGSGSGSATGGTIDFGGGGGGSTGANILLSAHTTEIEVTKPNAIIYALANTWNPGVQGTNASGRYPVPMVFASPTTGPNIQITQAASGAQVYVGPIPVPTPTPSFTPSPTPSPTSTPTPT
jgi:hypothetical protein